MQKFYILIEKIILGQTMTAKSCHKELYASVKEVARIEEGKDFDIR